MRDNDNRPDAGVSPERLQMLAYLERGADLSARSLALRFEDAVRQFDTAIGGANAADARIVAIPGEWTIAQVVDHVAQTMIRSAEELRHLLAGRQPPAPPVYAALLSDAAAWEPWKTLVHNVRVANWEFNALLAQAERFDTTHPGIPGTEPAFRVTVKTILVVNRAIGEGRVEPETFTAELSWQSYVLVQRLHLLDHRTQVRKLRAALAVRPPEDSGRVAGALK
jgi:hypothetical protein